MAISIPMVPDASNKGIGEKKKACVPDLYSVEKPTHGVETNHPAGIERLALALVHSVAPFLDFRIISAVLTDCWISCTPPIDHEESRQQFPERGRTF